MRFAVLFFLRSILRKLTKRYNLWLLQEEDF